jgi:molybdate transport system substrate-binding protein
MYTTRGLGPLFSLILIYFVLVPVACADSLTISAAASMKDALTDAGHQFEQKTGDPLTFSFLASGPLMKQIEEGAPVDVFISAAIKQMDELRTEKLIDEATERVIAKGELVLIVPVDEKDAPSSFADLADPKYKRIGIGEPKSVPAGDYAMETLRSLHLADAVKDRLQTAANVRQVLTYVERGEVDAGIVYRTDALSSKKVRIVAVAEQSTHKPIEYPAAVIKSSKEHDEAERFLEFLGSAQGKDVLKRYGFLIAD